MILTPAWTQLRRHEVQAALWRCTKRFTAVPAGRGSGKTELSKRRLVRFLAIQKDWYDPRYFYGAPTEAQAKRIAWDHLNMLIPPDWVRRRIGLTIETVFGSSLSVVGLDKPQRIEGTQWDGCVLDESCDLKPGTFDNNVLPSLTHRNGWCWRIGVPKRHGPSAVEFKKFYEAACAGEMEEAAGFTWPSSDILSPESLKFARHKMDTRDYREQFDAVWQDISGGVFHAFSVEFNVRPCEYHADRALLVGSDFNVDPMAWVIGHEYSDPDRVEWFDEVWLHDTNTKAALDVLFARYSSHKGGFMFFGDATAGSRKTSASESDYAQIFNDDRFKALGRTVHYPRANPGVDDRFAACNAMFQNAAGDRRMFVSPVCIHLIEDLCARAYKPGTREVNDSGDVGHMTDAMGYPIHALHAVRVELDYGTPVVSVSPI